MSRSIELAFLDEGEVPAALELMRRTLQPTSKSLPHVTLRHSPRARSERWGAEGPNESHVHITLEGATTFDSTADRSALRTVVIACTSEEFEQRVYKPDFPSSVLHITVYDGGPSRLAMQAYRVLSSLHWGLTFPSSYAIWGTSREALEHSTSKSRGGTLLTEAAEALRHSIYLELGISQSRSLIELDDSERLAVLRTAARSIHENPSHQPRQVRSSEVADEPLPAPGQLAFWTPEEIWSISGATPGMVRRSKRVRGAFATPPELASDVARSVAEYVTSTEAIRFGDPAFGNGVLYTMARRELGPDRFLPTRVVELDTETARLAAARWGREGVTIVASDFLQLAPETDAWSLVIANPPYRRSQEVSRGLEDTRAAIEDALSLRLPGRADLFVYFVLRTHAWLTRGAIAAWIIPAEFQVTSYGAALREYLSTRVTLLRIHTYDSRDPVFDNALTSTSVVIYRNEPAQSVSEVMITGGGTMSDPELSLHLPISRLNRERRWNFATLSSTDPSEPFEKIADQFLLKRGIATGANSYFVLEDAAVERMGVLRRWIRPLVPAARDLQAPVIAQAPDGSPIPSSGRWLIDTDDSVEEVRELSPAFADYLEMVLAAVGDRYLVARRVSPFKQEHREPAPFLFVYMAQSDSPSARFIRNESAGAYLNNYIGMYPRAGLQVSSQTLDDLHRRLDLVRRDQFAVWGRSYGKGLLKLEPRDLGNVTLPALEQ